jgi:hypothetical protein
VILPLSFCTLQAFDTDTLEEATMLGKIFARFVEKSPISVMVRGTLERVLGADQLDTWFAQTAQKPYTRTGLFATVSDILSHVVFRIQPSVRAAYQDHKDQVGASRISLYNKRNGVETYTSAALVRSSPKLPRQCRSALFQINGLEEILTAFTAYTLTYGNYSVYFLRLWKGVNQILEDSSQNQELTCVHWKNIYTVVLLFTRRYYESTQGNLGLAQRNCGR